MDDIQKAIDAGATAPRVTPADLEAEIHSEHYFTAADGVFGELASDGVPPTPFERQSLPETLRLLTFCVLVLKNGIKVTGESACVSAENFDAAIGRRLAREDALRKLWPLLGFRLADKLANPTIKWDGTPDEALRPGAVIRVEQPKQPGTPSLLAAVEAQLEEALAWCVDDRLATMRRTIACELGRYSREPNAAVSAAMEAVEAQRPAVEAHERRRLVQKLFDALLPQG